MAFFIYLGIRIIFKDNLLCQLNFSCPLNVEFDCTRIDYFLLESCAQLHSISDIHSYCEEPSQLFSMKLIIKEST